MLETCFEETNDRRREYAEYVCPHQYTYRVKVHDLAARGQKGKLETQSSNKGSSCSSTLSISYTYCDLDAREAVDSFDESNDIK